MKLQETRDKNELERIQNLANDERELYASQQGTAIQGIAGGAGDIISQFINPSQV